MSNGASGTVRSAFTIVSFVAKRTSLKGGCQPPSLRPDASAGRLDAIVGLALGEPHLEAAIHVRSHGVPGSPTFAEALADMQTSATE